MYVLCVEVNVVCARACVSFASTHPSIKYRMVYAQQGGMYCARKERV